MNAEQKQRAQEARQEWVDYEWSGADSGSEFEVVEIANKMAALLQELIDAPAKNQSEQHLEMVNAPAPSVLDSKTLQFLTDVLTAAGLLSHGKKDVGLATRIADESCRIRQQLFTQPAQPAELVRDAERYRWLLKQAWFQSAVDRFDFEDGGMQNRFEKCMGDFADAAIERDKLKGGAA